MNMCDVELFIQIKKNFISNPETFYPVSRRRPGKLGGLHFTTDENWAKKFSNAEPLINWPVIRQVLEYCDSMAGLTFEFAINTNLALMTRQIAELLKRYQVRIATSLDGDQAANDAIRITKGGQGTFIRILENFNLLAEIGYPLNGFSITVAKGNKGGENR